MDPKRFPHLRDTGRTLSEEFSDQSPNTQQYIKALTDGVAPTSSLSTSMTHFGSTPAILDEDSNIAIFNRADQQTRAMMFQHGLICPGSPEYTEYIQEMRAVAAAKIRPRDGGKKSI
jgi:hypothetical protein